jgi:Aromatic-ring-opening dioxygenase LigAB, LigA subunit
MSLYNVQKLLFQLNRDPGTRQRYQKDFEGLRADYALTDEELGAIRTPDIGLLYVMGVNGQLLMHYAALRGFEWSAYIEAMKEGERKYGPVRTGLYSRAEGRR